jgi:hypothetical protein
MQGRSEVLCTGYVLITKSHVITRTQNLIPTGTDRQQVVYEMFDIRMRMQDNAMQKMITIVIVVCDDMEKLDIYKTNIHAT